MSSYAYSYDNHQYSTMARSRTRYEKGRKDKIVAGIFAIFLGWLGVHRFYLGQVGWGIFYLVLAVTGLSAILAFIDAVAFFAMSSERFNRKYNPQLIEEVVVRRTYSTPAPQPAKRRAPSLTKVSRRKKQATAYKNEGLQKFKDYDYEGAVLAFTKAVEAQPEDPAAHYNLACCYSLLEQKMKAFQELDLAVRYGFKDFERVQTKEQLAYLRIQPEWESFVQNNYTIPSGGFPKSEQEQRSLLEELSRLKYLRDNNLISEEEYALLAAKIND